MAGYTKTDYDGGYRFRALIPLSNGDFQRSPVRVGYIRVWGGMLLRQSWERLAPLLDISTADNVLVIGAGYGWGCEALEDLTGCSAVGVDISDYIHATKNDTEETEIDAAIINAGFDPSTGHGLEVKNAVYCGTLKTQCVLIDNTAPATVYDAFGGAYPTLIITEDMISDLTDLEVLNLKTDLNAFGVPVAHLVSESIAPNNKTAQQWADFLPDHKIITAGDYKVL